MKRQNAPARSPRAARPRHAGQALPLVLLLLSVCGAAWAALYNLGQVAAARARLTHAADAAAYSAALAQARALNLLSYINRAQVAHQVAMAHLVTLASWAKFSDTQAARAAMGNPPASLIASLFGARAASGYRQARDTGGVTAELARAFAAHDDLVHNTLARAARRQAEDLPAQREAMLSAVLRANYPELAGAPGALSYRWLADGWPGRAQRQTAGELEQLTLAAAGRFAFLRPRDLAIPGNWMVSPYCPDSRHKLRRQGNTQFDGQGWSSNDTLSFHALRANRWIGCYYREYPMGWGLAGWAQGGAVQSAPEDFSQEDFWRWVANNTSWDLWGGNVNSLAQTYAFMQRVDMQGRGLPEFYQVQGGQALRFAVAVRQDTDTLPVAGGASRVALAGVFGWRAFDQGENMTVTSAAETFFVRPQARADGRTEAATLFRPYWQARRVAVSEAEQALARSQP
jgi:hypothetical protein